MSARHPLFEKIGNTPLRVLDVNTGGNRIFLKEECANPFGSHYDRVYPVLYQRYEELGILQPGMTVLETTSGSAGVSFAGIGRLLGYKCIVAMPEGTENAREEAIRAEGADIILTPKDLYVNGFPPFLKKFRRENPDVVFLNHSMGQKKGTENRVVTDALGAIAHEILDQLATVDYFVVAVGNGSSILGPGRVFKQKTGEKTRVVTFESFQSGVAHDILHPGRYKEQYGFEIGELPRHKMYGTSFPGINFPHIRIAIQGEKLVSGSWLVSDQEVDANYLAATGKKVPDELPRWDAVELRPYGRSTRAGLAVALKLVECVKDKNIVFIAYDKEDRYD